MPNTSISSKLIKIVSPFKGNEAWLQTSISYEILPLNRDEEMYFCIRKYVRYIDMKHL